MTDIVKPIARKKTTHLIHCGTNNLPSTELSEFPQKNGLVSLVSSMNRDTVIFLGIISHVDNNGKYTDKVVKVNKPIMDVVV